MGLRPIASCRPGRLRRPCDLRCRRGSSDATHGKADLGAQPGRPLQTSPRCRDALRALENSPRLRADAAQGTFRRARRIPPRRHCAEPQNARAPDSWAATRQTARIVCLRSLMLSQSGSHQSQRRSSCLNTRSRLISAGSESPKSATPIEKSTFSTASTLSRPGRR